MKKYGGIFLSVVVMSVGLCHAATQPKTEQEVKLLVRKGLRELVKPNLDHLCYWKEGANERNVEGALLVMPAAIRVVQECTALLKPSRAKRTPGDWSAIFNAVDRACASLGSTIHGGHKLSGVTRLPVYLKYLTGLESLQLINSSFERSETLADLSGLSELKALAIHPNEVGYVVSGTPIDHLPDLSKTKLLALDVRDNDLTLSNILTALKTRAQFIEFLDVSGTKVSQNELADLARMPKLKELHLDGLGLTELPAQIANLTNLVHLSLNKNKFQHATGLAHLSGCSSLEVLSLGENGLFVLPDMSNLQNLEVLYLADNKLTSKEYTQLGNLTKLETLVLRNNQLDGKGLNELFKLNLTYLDLSDNKLSKQAKKSVEQKFSKLEQLFLE